MIRTIVEIEHVNDFSEQGFYSKSYLALDKRLNRHVAVKDILYDVLKSEGDFENYFEESYKLSLATHPRVLPVYFVGLCNTSTAQAPVPRIVTQYFKNGSLNKVIESTYANNRTLNLDTVIRFAHDVIQGMIHLHSLNIVHLDLKASNIFVGDDNKLVIGDFGQAKFINEGALEVDFSIYPAIAPIEASAERIIDKTADIYQFGLLLYSMLCYDKYRKALEQTFKIDTRNLVKAFREKDSEAKKHFKGNIKAFTAALREEKFPDKNDYPYYVPIELRHVIHRCLAPNVADRYNNFYQIQEAINLYIFPKGVSEVYQELNSNVIHYVKDDKSYALTIEPNGPKYDLSLKKNDKNVTAGVREAITSAKLNKVINTLMSEL